MPAQWKNSTSSRSLLGKGPLELSLEWDYVRKAFQTNARAKSPSSWSLGITGCQLPLPYSRQSFAPVGHLHLSENKLFCLSWEQKFIKGKETESGSCWYLRPEGASPGYGGGEEDCDGGGPGHSHQDGGCRAGYTIYRERNDGSQNCNNLGNYKQKPSKYELLKSGKLNGRGNMGGSYGGGNFVQEAMKEVGVMGRRQYWACYLIRAWLYKSGRMGAWRKQNSFRLWK